MLDCYFFVDDWYGQLFLNMPIWFLILILQFGLDHTLTTGVIRYENLKLWSEYFDVTLITKRKKQFLLCYSFPFPRVRLYICEPKLFIFRSLEVATVVFLFPVSLSGVVFKMSCTVLQISKLETSEKSKLETSEKMNVRYYCAKKCDCICCLRANIIIYWVK